MPGRSGCRRRSQVRWPGPVGRRLSVGSTPPPGWRRLAKGRPPRHVEGWNRPMTRPQPDGAGRPRLGPRPLPLHLGLAAWQVTSSSVALPISSGAWTGWKPHLAQRAESLREELARADPDALGRAVIAEGLRRFGTLLTGIERYRHHKWRRDVADPPATWCEGTTALRDYGGEGPPVLFVPGLGDQTLVAQRRRDAGQAGKQQA